MARAGRKRKLGTRYESGDIVPQPRVSREIVASLQPHRQWLPEHLRLSPKAENFLGRLNLYGTVTDDQYEAGRRFAEIVQKYRSVIGAPKSNPASISGEFVRGSFELDEDECLARKIAYNWAVEAFSKAVVGGVTSPSNSQMALKAVSRVAVHGEECPTSVDYLIAGLDCLIGHFGIKTNVVPFELRAVTQMETGRTIAY